MAIGTSDGRVFEDEFQYATSQLVPALGTVQAREPSFNVQTDLDPTGPHTRYDDSATIDQQIRDADAFRGRMDDSAGRNFTNPDFEDRMIEYDPQNTNNLWNSRAGDTTILPPFQKIDYVDPQNRPRITVTPKTEGNIDLNARPIVKNADGSISTVNSFSFGTDEGEVLVPGVSHDGSRRLTEDEALQQYRETGQHLGIFNTVDEANKYAQQLHEDQAKLYLKPMDEPFKDDQEKATIASHIAESYLDPFEAAAMRQKRAVLSKDKKERTLPLATLATHMAEGVVRAVTAPGRAYQQGLTPEEETSAGFSLATLLLFPAPVARPGSATLGTGAVKGPRGLIYEEGKLVNPHEHPLNVPKGWDLVEGGAITPAEHAVLFGPPKSLIPKSLDQLEHDLAMLKHEHDIAAWAKWHPGEPLPSALESFKPHYPEPDWGKLTEPKEPGIIDKLKQFFNSDTIKVLFKDVVADMKTPKETNDLMTSFGELMASPIPKNTKMTPEQILDVGISNIAHEIQAKRTYSQYLAQAGKGDPLLTEIEHTALSFVDRWNPKAREARAQAQGFTTDAYHGNRGSGSGREWETLAIKAPREYGFYSTAHPELAELYASSGHGIRPNILPLKINTSEYMVVDAKGNTWTAINDRAIQRATEQGKKGVVIHNVWDEPGTKGVLSEPKTVFITLDPTTVRSKFAKFSTEGLGLNNLLASGAAIILGKSVVDEAKKDK